MRNKLKIVIQAVGEFPKKEITQEELEALIIIKAEVIYKNSIKDYIISLIASGAISPKDNISYLIKL